MSKVFFIACSKFEPKIKEKRINNANIKEIEDCPLLLFTNDHYKSPTRSHKHFNNILIIRIHYFMFV